MGRLGLLRYLAASLVIAVLSVGAIAPAHAQAGAFLACYRNKPLIGGVSVMLRLVVVTPSKTMSGNVSFAQPISPPLDVSLPVEGGYKNIRRGRHAAHLTNPPMVGRGITMNLVFSANWKAAKGSYALWLDTPGGLKKGKVVLRQTPCAP